MSIQNLPFNNFPGGSVRGPLRPVGGVVIISEGQLGLSIRQAACIQVQATADFSVDVLGPMGVIELNAPYSPYPGPGPAAGGANEVVLIRGRWNALRVNTQGDVYVLIDSDFRAYGGV